MTRETNVIPAASALNHTRCPVHVLADATDSAAPILTVTRHIALSTLRTVRTIEFAVVRGCVLSFDKPQVSNLEIPPWTHTAVVRG